MMSRQLSSSGSFARDSSGLAVVVLEVISPTGQPHICEPCSSKLPTAGAPAWTKCGETAREAGCRIWMFDRRAATQESEMFFMEASEIMFVRRFENLLH